MRLACGEKKTQPLGGLKRRQGANLAGPGASRKGGQQGGEQQLGPGPVQEGTQGLSQGAGGHPGLGPQGPGGALQPLLDQPHHFGQVQLQAGLGPCGRKTPPASGECGTLSTNWSEFSASMSGVSVETLKNSYQEGG